MSNSNIYTAGLNNVGSYMTSGMPYTTSSVDASTATKIEFPYVTRWVIVQNNSTSDDLKVGFSEHGVEGSNYFLIYNRQAASTADRSSICPRLELKLSEIWISGSNNVEIIAGLTNIAVDRINNISLPGNNWSGSSGVG